MLNRVCTCVKLVKPVQTGVPVKLNCASKLLFTRIDRKVWSFCMSKSKLVTLIRQPPLSHNCRHQFWKNLKIKKRSIAKNFTKSFGEKPGQLTVLQAYGFFSYDLCISLQKLYRNVYTHSDIVYYLTYLLFQIRKKNHNHHCFQNHKNQASTPKVLSMVNAV